MIIIAVANRLTAVDGRTGYVRWQVDLPVGDIGNVEVLMEGGYIFASPATDRVFAFNLRTGKKLWEKTTGSFGRATMMTDGERVYVLKGTRMVAFTHRGEIIWNSEVLSGQGPLSIVVGLGGRMRYRDEPVVFPEPTQQDEPME